jgi:hypothetical protein
MELSGNYPFNSAFEESMDMNMKDQKIVEFVGRIIDLTSSCRYVLILLRVSPTQQPAQRPFVRRNG